MNGGGHNIGQDQELGRFASSPPSQQYDAQYGEICTISRSVCSARFISLPNTQKIIKKLIYEVLFTVNKTKV